MSLAGFTHIGTYTLPTMAGTHTNFPVLLRYADFHPDVISALKADASDLRLSLSDDTQIPHHVARWNPSSNDILVHCCPPSAATGTELKIWGDNPSATMLDPTDPFGQYAAYNGWSRYAHDGRTNVANATVSSYSGAEPDGTSPFSGISTGYDGVDDTTSTAAGYDLDVLQTFVAMAKVNAFPTSGYGAIVSIVQSTDPNRHSMLAVDSSQRVRANKDRYISDGAQGATVLSTGTWYHMAATMAADGPFNHIAYLNGVQDGISTQDNEAQYVNVNSFRIGSRFNQDFFDGEIAHVGLRQGVRESADWMADHASNLTAVGAWGTMTSTGGGGTSQPITVVNATQAETANTLTLSQSAAIASVSATQQESASTLLINLAQQLAATNAIQNENASAVSITQSGSQEIQSVVATQNESAATLNLSQQQQLASIVAAQIESAGFTNLTSAQALTLVLATQNESASPITINQSDGQLITIIDAVQAETAQTIFISQVSVAQLNQASQNEVAQTLSIAQLQPLVSVNATQIELAQILNIIHSGDKADLTGITLVPVTSVYSLTQINNPIYSLEEN